MKAAIMGYGTIGSGVYEVLTETVNCREQGGEPIKVKYILDSESSGTRSKNL